MKKIFSGIGILVALFSIFFFLLVADRMVYHNNKTIHNFALSKSISGQELKEFAENTGITIRLVDFKNTSFGEKDLIITFINPDSSIRLGKQSSIFPKENIVYHILDQTKNREIKYLTVQEDDDKKIESFKLLLDKNGYLREVDEEKPINFSMGMLFSPMNFSFFALLTILLTLSIATYYVYRLKEIGVLKLNGWSNKKISFRFLFELLIHLFIFSLSCIIPFGIYVVISDASKMVLLAKIYFLVCLFLLAVFLLATFVGVFFINNVNQIGAIKNKKNNKLIFYALLIFKIATTIFLLISMNNSVSNFYRLNSTINSCNKFIKYDFFQIRTSVTPEDTMHIKLDELVGSLDSDYVFNYASPEQLMDITKLNLYKSKRDLRGIDECAYTDISANMLNVIDILDESGRTIKATQVRADSNTLLIPIHFKNNTEKILEYYQLGKDTSIIYIQNGQIHSDILCPGLYVYDSVYFIHRLQKVLYLNNGDVLISKKGAEKLESALWKMGVDKYSISVEPMTMEYNNFKASVQLDLVESLFHFTINILSFFLCVLSILTIFLQLRKKEFGVYKLIGRYPMIIILKFIGMNAIITVIITMSVNLIFLPLMAIESIIYGVLIKKYIKSKAILALKGE